MSKVKKETVDNPKKETVKKTVAKRVNPWIAYLQATSKNTGRKFSELLKDPKIKENYKKSKVKK